MKLREGWLEIERTASTQADAERLIESNKNDIGVVFAHDQTAGRGRFGREWLSRQGESLTMSLIFWDYPDWESPWLIGMSAALAAAKAIGCNLRWPNDLFFGDRKVGGALTELISTPDHKRIPVVGVGLNLGQREFPPKIPFATSVYRETGSLLEPGRVAVSIISEIRALPEPNAWSDLEPEWRRLDRTPGKSYVLPDGRIATAITINADGVLKCRSGSEECVVYAADALFGAAH